MEERRFRALGNSFDINAGTSESGGNRKLKEFPS
jgi:hypothetical protein